MQLAEFQVSDELLPVSAQTITKDGQCVSTGEVIWQFRASRDGGKLHRLDWSRPIQIFLPRQISERALHIFKLYLAQRLCFSKGHTIENDFQTFLRFLRWLRSRDGGISEPLSWEQLSFTTLTDFLAEGMKSTSRGNDFARMRDFYAWGAFGGRYPEFNEHLALGLKAIRAQGNVKGAAVRFGHINHGPLSIAERNEITRAIEAKQGTAEQRVTVMVHLELGPNPNAVARLKNADLKKFEMNVVERGRSSCLHRYQLELPRVKKRAEFRQTKARPISSALGELIESLRRGGSDESLFHWLNPDQPERGIARLMNEWVEHAQIISPRTGRLLNLSPRRFRYTLGTEAAREGASRATIAQLLDHSDLQNVEVYVEASSYVVDQVGSRFDALFAPVVSHFKGKIVGNRNYGGAAVHVNVIPSTSSHLPLVDVGGIGMCGRDVRKDGLCNLAPPLTCYACEFFAAFRNGPHQQVLKSLENVRASMVDSSDLRIPMQLDRVIAAAHQLINQIEAEPEVESVSRGE